LAYALGNLYRQQFVIPESEVTGILLAAFYLQFAELKNEYVSRRLLSISREQVRRAAHCFRPHAVSHSLAV